MKVKKISLILISSTLAFQGCPGPRNMRLSAIPSTEQQVGYQETITSQKKHFVSLAPYREFSPSDSNTSFVLFVKNCGKEPIDLGTNNVSVTFEGNTGKWASRKIAVLSHDDLMEEWRREISAEMSVARLYIDTYYPNEYDLDAKKIGPMIPSINRLNTQMALLDKLAVKPQTLLPGENCGGLVVCDTLSMDDKTEGKFQVLVSVNGEEHEFTFNRGLYQ